MTNDKASVIIGNIPVYGDECYSIAEYQEAKTLAVQALSQAPTNDDIVLTYDMYHELIADRAEKLELEDTLHKIFSIVHPLSIVSTPELLQKAITQIVEMVESLGLQKGEEIWENWIQQSKDSVTMPNTNVNMGTCKGV